MIKINTETKLRFVHQDSNEIKDLRDLDPPLTQVLGRRRGGLEGIRGGDIRGTPGAP